MCSAAVVRNIRHDVGNVTVQNAAKHVDGVGADALVPLHPGDPRRADTVLFDEGVLADAFPLPVINGGREAYSRPAAGEGGKTPRDQTKEGSR